MGKKPQYHKSIKLYPHLIANDDGEVLSLADEMSKLREDVYEVQSLVNEYISDERRVLNVFNSLEYGVDDTGRELPSQNDAIGDRLGIKLPEYAYPYKTGRSRFQMMYQGKLISELKGWKARVDAARGDTELMSAGWKRTINDNAPTIYPKMSLSYVNKQYAYIANDPLADGYIILNMVIRGEWRVLTFEFNKDRFPDAVKVALPDIQVSKHNRRIIFNFSVVHDIPMNEISDNYIIGVDMGLREYATLSVYSVHDEKAVYSCTLSRRFHSLWNSARATQRQVSSFYENGKWNYTGELHEQRASLKRKRRELAILAAQEIVGLSARYGNAAIMMEDLSWLVDTMQHGRWNIGELRSWVEHYAAQNGTVVYKVSAANTSQDCHSCGARGSRDWGTRLFSCPSCGYEGDCDVNASANIAKRGVGRVVKTCATRRATRSRKRVRGNSSSRVPVTRDVLRHPGTLPKVKARDRSKSGPTPSRPRVTRKRVILPVAGEVKSDCTPDAMDERGYRGHDDKDHCGTVMAASDDSIKGLVGLVT